MQEEFAMEITLPILSEQDRYVQRRNLSIRNAPQPTPSWNRGA